MPKMLPSARSFPALKGWMGGVGETGDGGGLVGGKGGGIHVAQLVIACSTFCVRKDFRNQGLLALVKFGRLFEGSWHAQDLVISLSLYAGHLVFRVF